MGSVGWGRRASRRIHEPLRSRRQCVCRRTFYVKARNNSQRRSTSGGVGAAAGGIRSRCGNRGVVCGGVCGCRAGGRGRSRVDAFVASGGLFCCRSYGGRCFVISCSTKKAGGGGVGGRCQATHRYAFFCPPEYMDSCTGRFVPSGFWFCLHLLGRGVVRVWTVGYTRYMRRPAILVFCLGLVVH